MWQKRDGLFYLRKTEAELANWLPSLHHKPAFAFRPDIEIQWDHSWPTDRLADCKAIYFYRDPRDSLYSRYKRQGAMVGFGDYLDTPEPFILLNKIECNCLHAACWLQHPQVELFRFEDYKKDAESTLRRALDYLKIEASDEAILRALNASTADKAKEVEQTIKASTLSEKHKTRLNQTVNQGGIVGRWKELSGRDDATVSRIETVARQFLLGFGYQFDAADKPHYRAGSYMDYLSDRSPFSGDLIHLDFGRGDPQEVAALERRTLQFARGLTSQFVSDANMSQSELRTLLVGLAIFSARRDRVALTNIETVAAQFFGESDLHYRLFQRTKNPAWLRKIKARFVFDKLFRPEKLRSKARWVRRQ